MSNINKSFAFIFCIFGLLIQLITYIISGDSILSFISGIAGVLSVVLCSCKKISFYFWGFLQLFTYVILAWEQNFWGEIVENGFYFVTMLYGIYLWGTHYNTDENEVEIRSLSITWNIILGIIFCIGTILLYYILDMTNDTQPFMDAISTVPAFIAQILMIYRYREQWIYWLILDVLSIVLWTGAENWCMVAQFAFWTINCIYGWILWKKS